MDLLTRLMGEAPAPIEIDGLATSLAGGGASDALERP